MHDCIEKLLAQKNDESLECLCRLITTVGQVGNIIIISKSNMAVVFKILEQETAVVLAKGNTLEFFSLDSYFASLDRLVREKKTSSRVRFLIQVRIDFSVRLKWI